MVVMMGWHGDGSRCGVEGGGDVTDLWWSRWWHWGAAVVVVLEVVAARGGEWYGGSYRSGEGEHFWGSPEKSLETAAAGGGMWQEIMECMMSGAVTQSSLDFSFRRVPWGGVEHEQFADLVAKIEGISLVNMRDWWIWSFEGSSDFSVALVRKLIDDKMLPEVSSKIRWIKAVPIKVNVFAWKVRFAETFVFEAGLV
nr:RNA-directed DNA polymerase, eukaryota [Tanacetum cinerariifolium]